MFSSLGCLLLCGSIALVLGNAQKLPKGKSPSLKVHINTTSDSILLKFLRPSPNVKLEGFLLGYGSNVSPNQYFPLPTEGKYNEAVVDAEPRYLIVVRPAPPPSQKKKCSGKSRTRKPLQLVVGTLTPSSVFLSWGFLINPHHDWTLPSHCPNDRFYTIRYREKDKEKKWVFQLCPATETIVENLKPNTVYEFGVKDNTEGGIWSKIFNHKTIVGSKNKVNGKIQSTSDQIHTVPSYVPRKIIPVTIIKQVIQNVTHRASTKYPDKTPFGGTILVHLVIPGLNETTIKLPTSMMYDISDAIKTQLAKNETLPLPAESKTPEVEKILAHPLTVTPESIPRTTKSAVSSALDISGTTLAQKKLPEFPQAKTPFPFEKPEGTLASSKKPWVLSTTKTSEDLKDLQFQTATYDVFSNPPTSQLEISEFHTDPSTMIFAYSDSDSSLYQVYQKLWEVKTTSNPILDSVPPKTSRPLEQPRATLAPSETSLIPQKMEIFISPEMQPTTSAPMKTTSAPSTPRQRPRPKKPRTKPERTTSPGTITSKISKIPEPTRITLAQVPQTPPPTQSTIGFGTLTTKPPTTTLAPRKTKRPGHRPHPRPRPRPKTSPSPDVPKSKPAPKPSKRPETTHKPEAPSMHPEIKPPEHPKPQLIAQPDMPPTKSVLEPVTFEVEVPSKTIVPKTSQRMRTRRPHPKRRTTPSPEVPQSELDPQPITPGTPLAPPTKRPRRPNPKRKTTPPPEVSQPKLVAPSEPVVLRSEAPVTAVAPKVPQRTHQPHLKPKITPSPAAPQTELVPATVFEPVTPIKDTPDTTFVPVTDLKPVTFTTPGTLVTKVSHRTRRPRPRPKTTRRPHVPQTRPVPATALDPVTLGPETPPPTLAPKTSQQTQHPFPTPKPVPHPEAPEFKPVPTAVLEPVTFKTESWVTTQAPKKSKRPHRPKPKSRTTTTETPQTKPDLELGTLRTEAPETTAPKTSRRTRRPRPTPKTTASPELPQAKPEPTETDYIKTHRPEEPKTEVMESITVVSEPPMTTLEASPLTPQTIILPSPDEPQTELVPKQAPHAPPKPKTSLRPRIPQTQPAPRDVLLPHQPDPDVSQSEPVLQPVTFRIELPETTIAPLETHGSPLIPVISPSPSQEELQTTQEETDQSTQELFTAKIPQTAELAKTTQAPHRLDTSTVRPRIPDKPYLRPILNKTTARPSRPRTSGTLKENGTETGIKQPPKPSGAGRNVSVDIVHSTKKPGTRRPPLLPRPTPPRRKPLPPNNVTGKPGSAGIISSGRITSPPLKTTFRPTGVPSEGPETDKKQPTAPASGEDLDNMTNFSSNPTRETDHLGKPIFKGSHVRYIPKPDDSPCSITDSIKLFPKEESIEGNITSPPQNPPTNLTVVTVEGCSSFVILDWEKPLNDTVTEYEVISRENGSLSEKSKDIQITNQTFSTVENLKPDTSYEFQVKPKNPLGEGPVSNTVAFNTESADPRVSEPVSAGRDAIWTERHFNSDSYSECKGKQYVKRTWYKKFVGVQLCNSLRYKIYLSDSLTGKFYNIGDQRGYGEDHCQFVDSFLDGRTGQQLSSDQLPTKEGYFRAVRQEPVQFGEIGGHTQINYVQWYECGTTIPGKW